MGGCNNRHICSHEKNQNNNNNNSVQNGLRSDTLVLSS
jgi:hypothetical protein